MPRDPFAGGAYEPGGIADPEADDDGGSSGGSSGGGRDRDRDRDRDPVDLSPGDSDNDGVPDLTDPEPDFDDGGSSSGGRDRDRGRDDGPNNAESVGSVTRDRPDPTRDDDDPADPGGTSDDFGTPNSSISRDRPDPTGGGSAGGSNSQSSSGQSGPPGDETRSMPAGPRSNPSRDDSVDDIASEVADDIASAEATDEIVDRATTGGLLSERGQSAGLLPDQLGDGGGAPIGDGRVDISETRLREIATDSLEFGQSIDAGAAFSSPADPLTDNRPIGSDAAPGSENPAEEFVEGAASLPFDLPGAALETETVGEIGQAAIDDDVFEDFGTAEVAETATAQGRDRAAETGRAIAENPAGFAGAVTAGAVVGAGGLARGSTGSLRQAARAELDPRIGPFGTTAETRLFRGARDFLRDDRGQAQLAGRSRGRDSGGSDGQDTDPAGSDDLGPDIDPFDRSDARLFDPSRQFDDDVGGMASDDIDAAISDRSSQQDIGAGISGRGNPRMAEGVDAESFSSRGFGDVRGTELDPNPTDTLGRFDRLSASGASVAGLFASVDDDLGTLGAGGLLGTPGDLDATGTTPDLGGRTRTVTTPFFDADEFADSRPRTDQPTDVRTDQPTDTGQDTPTDLFDTPTDTPTTDTPTTDQPTDRPTDRPTDIPSDFPSDRPERFRFDDGGGQDDERGALFGALGDTTVVNPTRTLQEVDDDLQAFFGGQNGP